MKIGLWLTEEKGKVPLKELATRLLVSVRTLQNWRALAASSQISKIGRPKHSESMHKKALWLVGRELQRQGYPGWRAISKSLNKEVPDRLVQLYVKKFKLRKRIRQRKIRSKNRLQIRIESKNVIWAQDGTHLGRRNKKSIEAQVIKDRGSQKVIATSTGVCAKGNDVIELLEAAKKERGLPLVWSTDNGSMYIDRNVKAYLEKEKIIHLKSLPQTPEHNGAAEISMREIKCGSDLGKGRSLKDVNQASEELSVIVKKLNENRLRASFNYETASAVDQKLTVVYTSDVRDRFYDECVKNMNSVAMMGLSSRRARLEIRNVVLNKLQEYGFIELKRGEGN